MLNNHTGYVPWVSLNPLFDPETKKSSFDTLFGPTGRMVKGTAAEQDLEGVHKFEVLDSL